MTNGYTNWLIMVYMSADGLLANFAVESLKQLKRAAGNGVVVVAQVDKDGDIPARKYVFDKSGSLADSKAQILDLPTGGTPDPKNLTEFINHAVGTYGQDKRRALFLWGHGPELLFDEDPSPKAGGSARKPIRKYLTPSELKTALKDTNLVNAEHKLDIIGLDACSMSMVEVASELGDYVKFMVASQEDVPDPSFPYADILPALTKITRPEDAAEKIPELYLNAYRDYIASGSTGVRGITLSAVDLGKTGLVIEALRKLSDALLKLSADPVASGKILEARRKAQAFVFGLFVDIVDLCVKLEASKIDSVELTSACAQTRKAIAATVIENEAYRNQANEGVTGGLNVERRYAAGLSIYFPYRIADPAEDLQELRAKGGSDRPLKGGSDRPLKERSLRIQELEEDFDDLKRFKATGWNEFIKRGWSLILAKEVPRELDEVYSAQQCAQNLGGGFGMEVKGKAA
jgi:Clostripain family